MTQLSVFSPEDLESIVSLPYRVAMNVSYAEDEDGDQDDELETRALEIYLVDVSKDEDRDGLSRDVAAQILNSKDKWETWSQGVFNIEPACEKAILALKVEASKDEVKAYSEMVVGLGVCVAQAYGEFGDAPEPEKGVVAKFLGSLMGVKPSNEVAHPMNVSAAEDSALQRIKAALKKHA